MDRFYFAPLQGATDFIYRNIYNAHFNCIDKYFTPFIRIEKNTLRNSYKKEIQAEQNGITIPQFLSKNIDDTKFLLDRIIENKHSEINWNLGCPYPMVAKKGMGSGLIKEYEQIDKILDFIFKNYSINLSVKCRLGYDSIDEIDQLIPVFNNHPLHEVIIHPRIGKQLYKGEVFLKKLEEIIPKLKHPLVYNGDIYTPEIFNKLKQRFPNIDRWMIGRGLLQDPFLVMKIKEKSYQSNTLIEFYNDIFSEYERNLNGPGHLLSKLKEFWMYFAHSFPEQEKLYKAIKKSKSMEAYYKAINKFNINEFRNS